MLYLPEIGMPLGSSESLLAVLKLDSKQFSALLELLAELSDEQLLETHGDAARLAAPIEPKTSAGVAAGPFAEAWIFLGEGVASGISDTEGIIQVLRRADLIETDEQERRVTQLMPITRRLGPGITQSRRRFRYTEGLMPNFHRVRVAANLRFIPAGPHTPPTGVDEGGSGELTPIGIVRIEHDERAEPFIFQVDLAAARQLQEALEELDSSLQALEARIEGGELS